MAFFSNTKRLPRLRMVEAIAPLSYSKLEPATRLLMLFYRCSVNLEESLVRGAPMPLRAENNQSLSNFGYLTKLVDFFLRFLKFCLVEKAAVSEFLLMSKYHLLSVTRMPATISLRTSFWIHFNYQILAFIVLRMGGQTPV